MSKKGVIARFMPGSIEELKLLCAAIRGESLSSQERSTLQAFLVRSFGNMAYNYSLKRSISAFERSEPPVEGIDIDTLKSFRKVIYYLRDFKRIPKIFDRFEYCYGQMCRGEALPDKNEHRLYMEEFGQMMDLAKAAPFFEQLKTAGLFGEDAQMLWAALNIDADYPMRLPSSNPVFSGTTLCVLDWHAQKTKQLMEDIDRRILENFEADATTISFYIPGYKESLLRNDAYGGGGPLSFITYWFFQIYIWFCRRLGIKQHVDQYKTITDEEGNRQIIAAQPTWAGYLEQELQFKHYLYSEFYDFDPLGLIPEDIQNRLDLINRNWREEALEAFRAAHHEIVHSDLKVTANVKKLLVSSLFKRKYRSKKHDFEKLKERIVTNANKEKKYPCSGYVGALIALDIEALRDHLQSRYGSQIEGVEPSDWIKNPFDHKNFENLWPNQILSLLRKAGATCEKRQKADEMRYFLPNYQSEASAPKVSRFRAQLRADASSPQNDRYVLTT